MNLCEGRKRKDEYMDNFSFSIPTRTVFGAKEECNVGKMILSLGKKKVLFHYGSGSICRSGLYDRVKKSLMDEDIEVFELGGVQPNPRVSKVREGVVLCKENEIDFILAVGGGSVIDSAKGIAIGALYDGDVWDFYDSEIKKPVKEALPVGVILTIPAAGSEGSAGSVVTNDEGNLKRDTGAECMRPVFAVLNPELCYTLPDYQVACGLADIMAHLMERYFTPTQNVDYTDALCEATMATVVSKAPIVMAERENYEAWCDIMWAGTLAHNDLMSAGRVGDWASHMIEHELSGLYDVIHGAGLAVVFPAWMKFVYKQDVARFVKFAVNVFGIKNDYFKPERVALAGIKALEDFFVSLGLPVTAEALGAKKEDFAYMAKMVVKDPKSGTVGQFVPLTEEDILKVFNLMIK